MGNILQFSGHDKKTPTAAERAMERANKIEVKGDESQNDSGVDTEGEVIDIGDITGSPTIMEVRNFVDISKGAQVVAFIDVNTKRLAALKGSVVFPVMTQQGPRGVQAEIDFPIEDRDQYTDFELDLMEHVKEAFDSYETAAEAAVEKKQKEMEDKSRIVSASGLPFDPKSGGKPFRKKRVI